MGVKLYGYDKCGTCRDAAKWLKAHEVEIVESIPVFETPPSVEELEKLVADSGLELKKFFNTSGEAYKELGLKDKLGSMSRQAQLELLAGNGRLIKRPIVTDGQQVTVGFKAEQYAAVWGKQA